MGILFTVSMNHNDFNSCLWNWNGMEADGGRVNECTYFFHNQVREEDQLSLALVHSCGVRLLSEKHIKPVRDSPLKMLCTSGY